MPATVTRDVIVKVRVDSAGGTAADPFDKIAKSSAAADASLKKMDATSKGAFAGSGASFDKLAGGFGKAKEGLQSVTAGLIGLSSSSDKLRDSLQHLTAAASGLSVLKGVLGLGGAVAGAVGLGAAAGAVGAAAAPAVGIAAGLVATGLVAVDQIWTYFGNKGQSALGAWWEAWQARGVEAAERSRAFQGQRERNIQGAIAVDRPVREQFASLAEQESTLRRRVESDRNFRHVAVGGETAQRRLANTFLDRLGVTDPRVRESAGDMARAGGERLAESSQAVADAQASAAEAAERQAKLQAELTAAQQARGRSAAIERDIMDRLLKASQDRIAAETAVADAMKNQVQAQREVQQAWLQFARQQRDHFQAIIEKEKERLDAGKQSFGRMGAADRNRAVSGAEALQRGDRLSEGQISALERTGLFTEQLQGYFRQRGDSDPQFNRLLGLSGQQDRIRDAERSRDVAARAVVKIEQQIKATVELGPESVANQISQAVIPEIHRLMRLTLDEMRNLLHREFGMQQNANRAPAG